MIRISLTPIMWYNHEQLPKKIKLTNTGYTAATGGQRDVQKHNVVAEPDRESRRLEASESALSVRRAAAALLRGLLRLLEQFDGQNEPTRLLDRQGEPIMHNCRPLAKALPSNERRRVFHVNPSGVCAYTLMQLISRDPPAYTVNQIEEMVRNYDEFVNAKAQ
ncbi:unnamed protein product [Trichogramma brassicae]|uniref:Uncharacterized protein n=1 Tax=Trichogramma brassicae TaxID=86971 RepID=A0A6H5IJY2_9HYME|nr:unnamed protein product [Trichogramma brassicae]